MDEFDDYGCDDYYETHDYDDLNEWETEQVFQDEVLEREAERRAHGEGICSVCGVPVYDCECGEYE